MEARVVANDAYPRATQSPFELGRVNPTIPLVEGTASLRRGRERVDLDQARIFISAHPSWGVRFNGEGHSNDPKIIDRALGLWAADEIHMPTERAQGSVFEGTTQLGGNFDASPYVIRASGELRKIETGGATKFRQLNFHLANFPDFHGSRIMQGTRTWTGRLHLRAGDWEVALDSRPVLSELTTELRAHGGFAITHVCSLTKRNQSFSRLEAEEALNNLHWFLSFVRGAWTSPILLMGRSVNGKATWCSMRPGRTDAFGGSPRWCDWTNWGAAQEAYGGYMRLWVNPAWQQGLRVAIGHYITANRPNPIETAIVAAQSGLELLGWLSFVESRHTTQKVWRNLNAADKIRRLLRLGTVDLSIPGQLSSLVGLDSAWKDGPAVIVGVRNKLTHPRQSEGRVSWPGQVLVDAWLLISRYLELALLHAMDVRSGIRDRLGSSHWAGATVNPPWVP
jgi:hypothetical protein